MNTQKMAMQEMIEEAARELLFEMTNAARKEKMTAGQVEEVAKLFMAGYPYQSENEFLEAVREATKEYSFLSQVYAKYKGMSEEEEVSVRLAQIRASLRQEKGAVYGI